MSVLSSYVASGILVVDVDDEFVGRRPRWLKRLRRTLELEGGWRAEVERVAMFGDNSGASDSQEESL